MRRNRERKIEGNKKENVKKEKKEEKKEINNRVRILLCRLCDLGHVTEPLCDSVIYHSLCGGDASC